MRMWLDDLRTPPDESWKWVKTAPEALQVLEEAEVEEISFDHDLGSYKWSGCTVAAFIEEQAASKKKKPPKWAVHSANPVGRDNIERAMRRADRFWEEQ